MNAAENARLAYLGSNQAECVPWAELKPEIRERRERVIDVVQKPIYAEQAPMGEEIVRLRQQLYNMNAILKLLTQGDDIRTEEIRGVEDVPLYVPERASDAGYVGGAISEIGIALKIAHDEKFSPYSSRGWEYFRAVRARVEAPLLAEIQRLTEDCNIHLNIKRDLMSKLDATRQTAILAERDCDYLKSEVSKIESERDTFKARVAELEAEIRQAGIDFELAVKSRDWQHEAHLACKKLADELRAELEAIKEIPEVAELITRRPDESLSTAVMRLRNERNDLCNKLSSRDERITSLVSELEAVTVERDHKDAGWNDAIKEWERCQGEVNRLKTELAALHQPVDAPTDAQVEALARVLADACAEGFKESHTTYLRRLARAAFAHIGGAPVGAELDVTCQAIRNAWLDTEAADGNSWDASKAVLDLCRSRIRPVYECKECAETRKHYNDLGAIMQQVADLSRTAMDGE